MFFYIFPSHELVHGDTVMSGKRSSAASSSHIEKELKELSRRSLAFLYAVKKKYKTVLSCFFSSFFTLVILRTFLAEF